MQFKRDVRIYWHLTKIPDNLFTLTKIYDITLSVIFASLSRQRKLTEIASNRKKAHGDSQMYGCIAYGINMSRCKPPCYVVIEGNVADIKYRNKKL